MLLAEAIGVSLAQDVPLAGGKLGGRTCRRLKGHTAVVHIRAGVDGIGTRHVHQTRRGFLPGRL